jgi:RNA polymerase sigma-70 factor (ECF subfamily)
MRESLLLVGVGGYSCAEAATICAVATGTVKSRVARARRALATAMDGQKPLPPIVSQLRRRSAADRIVAELSRIDGRTRGSATVQDPLDQ